MLSKILVPLDGSELAERALSDATALSIPTAARLILMRAVVAHTLPGVDARAAQVDAVGEADGYLRGVATGLQHRGFACEIATPYGPAADWILEEASLRHADMIVMTTHSRSGPARWLVGSVAESVLARATLPVLLVRAWQPRERELLLQDRPRLLVPLDGSVFAEAALPAAAALAEDVGAELVLTRVQPSPTGVLTANDGQVLAYVDQEEEALAAEATDYLTSIARTLAEQRPGVRVSTRVQFGEPVVGITASAAETNAALIVMATHGRTGLSRAVFGSVAGRVLEHGTTSLVLVRPPNPEHVATAEKMQPRSVW
jgi:nucleotide-binding universal stress UspA family protein